MGGGEEKLLANHLYFLMSYKGEGKKAITGTLQTKTRIDEEYQLLTNNIQLSYDFDPFMLSNETMEAADHFEAFSKFLDQRAMTIDIWNGDNFMHFGQVRVPLHFLMRQGSSRSVMG